VSHLRTWLEDELDVSGAVASEVANFQLIVEEQADDLLADKQHAFGSFFQFAQIDFQTFWLDFYVQQMFASLTAQQPSTASAATSLLEEESVSGEQAEFLSPLFALFALSGAGGQGMTTWSFYYKYYGLMLQFNAAQSGQTHYFLEHQIYNGEDDKTDYEKLQVSSNTAFTYWASSLMQQAQVNYMLAIFGMYGGLTGQQGAAAAQAK